MKARLVCVLLPPPHPSPPASPPSALIVSLLLVLARLGATRGRPGPVQHILPFMASSLVKHTCPLRQRCASAAGRVLLARRDAAREDLSERCCIIEPLQPFSRSPPTRFFPVQPREQASWCTADGEIRIERVRPVRLRAAGPAVKIARMRPSPFVHEAFAPQLWTE